MPDNIRPATFSPFGVLLLSNSKTDVNLSDDFFQRNILPLANQTGATQIIQQVKGGLLIGLLNQYRYWTPSRARLLAAEILRHHMSEFEV